MRPRQATLVSCEIYIFDENEIYSKTDISQWEAPLLRRKLKIIQHILDNKGINTDSSKGASSNTILKKSIDNFVDKNMELIWNKRI